MTDRIFKQPARAGLTRFAQENGAPSPRFRRAEKKGRRALPGADRKAIWGDPIDPKMSLADFEPKFITDAMLGKA
jgi:hypothetical protein